MYENGKVRPVETIQHGGRDKCEGGEFSYHTF
jgi:hypothetical protein